MNLQLRSLPIIFLQRFLFMSDNLGALYIFSCFCHLTQLSSTISHFYFTHRIILHQNISSNTKIIFTTKSRTQNNKPAGTRARVPATMIIFLLFEIIITICLLAFISSLELFLLRFTLMKLFSASLSSYTLEFTTILSITLQHSVIASSR